MCTRSIPSRKNEIGSDETKYFPNSTPIDTRPNEFHFQDELSAYCISDVTLLKEGSLTFKHDLKSHAAFNPSGKMTVASACIRYLHMHCLTQPYHRVLTPLDIERSR